MVGETNQEAAPQVTWERTQMCLIPKRLSD